MSLPLALFDMSHVPTLMIVGFALFAGTVGARVFQRLRIPQVVGYIAIGLLLGRSGLGLLGEETIARLLPFSFFALGVIGFMIGGELHREVFRRFGRQFFTILLAEGISAFLLVGALVTVLAYLWTGNLASALALGLVLGAISSATAPAATVDVLWEYKTRGILTTTVFAIVALDDGLALVLYSISSTIAMQLLGAESDLLSALGGAGYELGGAIVVGSAGGWLLYALMKWARARDKVLVFILGTLALVLGAALMLELDLILAAMVLGATISNLAPRRTNEAFQIVEQFAPPIYVLFFVFVGARLSIGNMSGWMWAIAFAYVGGRTGGKFLGSYLGARWAHAGETVRKYLGLCLFSQAGVAIGLAILAAERFGAAGSELSQTMAGVILTVVTATTFLVQVIGPPCVKFAVQKAGEVGLNITEEDLARSYTVESVMDATPPAFLERTTLAEILRTIADSDAMAYPVTDAEDHLVGVITIRDLKTSFTAEHLTHWLLAHDLMQPATDTITPDVPLPEALLRLREKGLEFLIVVSKDEHPRLRGLLELHGAERLLSREVVRRRQLADAQVA